ncbi:MAG TPA: ribosome-associated translation inhibitor RaiA [Terriglobales bacterium]|nr:ribosome-associated translation inhibitor RaiA [Terriglobales bacterium]
MNVEYTGRQYAISPAIRTQIDQGLAKLTKILGNNFEAHVILSVEKYRCVSEVTIAARSHTFVGLAESTDMSVAVGEALDRIERQAVKYKARVRAKKRQARKKWVAEAPAEGMQMAMSASAAASVPMIVHSFPSISRTTDAHIRRAPDSVALRPMTLEEAVKEAEFRDREVFVFRDPAGRVKVLHRTRDGRMELIEAP